MEDNSWESVTPHCARLTSVFSSVSQLPQKASWTSRPLKRKWRRPKPRNWGLRQRGRPLLATATKRKQKTKASTARQLLWWTVVRLRTDSKGTGRWHHHRLMALLCLLCIPQINSLLSEDSAPCVLSVIQILFFLSWNDCGLFTPEEDANSN